MKSLHRQKGFFAAVTIPAVATAVGAGLQYAGTQDTNQQNLSISMMNNARATDLANTAHQREVADLTAAGLNPILSANRSGAAVPPMSTPQMMNPMGHAATSGADLARSIQTGMKYHEEMKNLRQTHDIRSPLQTAAIDANTGLATIKEAVQGTLGAISDWIRPPVAGQQSGLEALLGGVQAIGEKTANTVSTSSAAALDRAQDTAKRFGVKISEVISHPQKYIEQRIHSAKDYWDKATALPQTIHRELSDRHTSRNQPRTNFTGNPADVLREIQTIKDPTMRAQVQRAYRQQLNREGR